MAQESLRRLPGRSGRWFAVVRQVSQIWAGDRYLLHVLRYGYSENVKRFDLNDIQMLVVFRTKTGAFLNAVFLVGMVAMVFGFMGFGGRWPWEFSTTQWIGCGIPSGVLGLCILLNTMLGPTCRTRLMTAVQVEDLPCLRRLRSARRTADEIREHVGAVQGSLSLEHLELDNPDIVDVTPAVHEVK